MSLFERDLVDARGRPIGDRAARDPDRREVRRSPCPAPAPEVWERDRAADEEQLAGESLSAELSRRLLRRLAEAWSDLNYQHLRGRLDPPSIRLHDSEARWGAWHAGRRLITIARRQVLGYTWESVVETLRHEMAHQVVSELYGEPDEAPHGEAFGRACGLLAADPAPRGDGGVSLFRPGGGGGRAGGVDPDDARLLRIQKLLALADNNPDEHEARAAFARASELMLKYNLDPRAAERLDYEHRFLGKSSGRVPHHHYLIASILQEFFFVQCIWVDSYDVRRGVRGHLVEVMGKRANVEVAEYVHACLIRQCETHWRAFKAQAAIRDRSAKRRYLDGLLDGFRRQLRIGKRASAEHGLVWVGDPGLERFAGKRHPRTTRTRIGGVGGCDIREEGVRAGERLRLHAPVSSRPAASKGRRLPGPTS